MTTKATKSNGSRIAKKAIVRARSETVATHKAELKAVDPRIVINPPEEGKTMKISMKARAKKFLTDHKEVIIISSVAIVTAGVASYFGVKYAKSIQTEKLMKAGLSLIPIVGEAKTLVADSNDPKKQPMSAVATLLRKNPNKVLVTNDGKLAFTVIDSHLFTIPGFENPEDSFLKPERISECIRAFMVGEATS